MSEVPFPWSIEVPFPFRAQNETHGILPTVKPPDANIESYPVSQACRLIDYDEDTVQINGGFINDTWFLSVSGTKPSTNIKIELVPLIYVRQPEYWGIEVVACQRGIGATVLTPYQVFISLNGIIGTKGIEVIGATKKKRFTVPPS